MYVYLVFKRKKRFAFKFPANVFGIVIFTDSELLFICKFSFIF